MQPELIIISGPNGAGKSTSIDNNNAVLKDFIIIQPDEELDKTSVMIDNALKQNKSFCLEDTLASQRAFNTAELAKMKGYETTLYQIYLNNQLQSIERVKFREENETGLFISEENITKNYFDNLHNLANKLFYFDTIFFIDGITQECKLTIKEKKIIQHNLNNKNAFFNYLANCISSERDVIGLKNLMSSPIILQQKPTTVKMLLKF